MRTSEFAHLVQFARGYQRGEKLPRGGDTTEELGHRGEAGRFVNGAWLKTAAWTVAALNA